MKSCAATIVMGLHIVGCVELPATYPAQGLIVVSDEDASPCAAILDLRPLSSEERVIAFETVSERVGARIYRSDFPTLFEVGLFRAHPCSQIELEADIDVFARDLLDIEDPVITASPDSHVIFVENYEGLTSEQQLLALVDRGNTGGYCEVRKEYDLSTNYMYLGLGATAVMRDQAFPLIDFYQSNNVVDYTFYIPCGSQVDSYVSDAESKVFRSEPN